MLLHCAPSSTALALVSTFARARVHAACVYILTYTRIHSRTYLLHALLCWCVHMVCSHGVLTWCVHMVCSHSVFTWCVHMVCSYGVFAWCVHMVCSHGVFVWCVHMMCSHGVFTCCIHIQWRVHIHLCEAASRLFTGLSLF